MTSHPPSLSPSHLIIACDPLEMPVFGQLKGLKAWLGLK